MKTTHPRSVVVAVCGSPGAGKTTVAAAVARRLGVPLLSRDEIRNGLGLSASPLVGAAARNDVARNDAARDDAEIAMVRTAAVLATAGVGFVVESSVISGTLLAVLHESGARVLAVHVVAGPAVIGDRLRARIEPAASSGERGVPAAGSGRDRAADERLAAQFASGEMHPAIFEPPAGADRVVRVDTSAGGEPPVSVIVDALRESPATDAVVTCATVPPAARAPLMREVCACAASVDHPAGGPWW